MSWLALPPLLLALAGIGYTLFACVLVERVRRTPLPAAPAPEPVTLLKPLHGAEPRLGENLATFLRQDWAAPIELVCGVQRADDPAIGVVEALAGGAGAAQEAGAGGASISPPFALSLSKPALSDCRRQAVEGGCSSSADAQEEEQGFDKLSPTGEGRGCVITFVLSEVEGRAPGAPPATIALVVDPTPHGANGKVANLINMWPRASHDLIVLSDSDMAVSPAYLGVLAATLEAPGVGAATCAYLGRGDAGRWSELAAAGVSYHFLPLLLLGLHLGAARPGMGSTIALRRETLERIGGFVPLAYELADDYAIGEAVRRLGLSVVVPPLLLVHASDERSLRQIWRHELRWASTILRINPGGHLGTIVTHPLSMALLALPLSPSWGASCLAATIVARIALKRRVDRMAGFKAIPIWLLPLRDLLSFAVFVASFCARSVDWRGARLVMGRDGRIARPTESSAR